VRLFVFGLGYSARAVVRRLAPQLEKAWGTTRSIDSREDMAALGVEPIVFEGHASPLPAPPSGELGVAAALSRATHLLVSIPPAASGDPVLNNFREELTRSKPQALVYLSTVGVYGDHAGGWVDETSECRPVSERSRQRLTAEQAWRAFADESGIPVAILRLAGIYGPGRGPFEKIRQGTARRIVKPGQVFNRIHVDDIAAIVEAAFDRRANAIFNSVDDEPAPPEDVLAYAAELLKMPPPPEIPFEGAEMSPMARSFYGENKRVRNDRIKRELGVSLRYASYREGLRAILATEAVEAAKRTT
jgi:hypothetical protein